MVPLRRELQRAVLVHTAVLRRIARRRRVRQVGFLVSFHSSDYFYPIDSASTLTTLREAVLGVTCWFTFAFTQTFAKTAHPQISFRASDSIWVYFNNRLVYSEQGWWLCRVFIVVWASPRKGRSRSRRTSPVSAAPSTPSTFSRRLARASHNRLSSPSSTGERPRHRSASSSRYSTAHSR